MKKTNQQGQIIIFALVFMGIMTMAAAALMGYTVLNVRGTRQDYNQNRALYLAQAGVNKAIYRLNRDYGYNGETGTELGEGSFSVEVSTVDVSTKKITATGYVPSSANPVAVRTIKAIARIDASVVSFNSGVQVGLGGLSMDNNSQVTGNVFSNGNITGGNGSITGDVVIAEGTSLVPDEKWLVQNNDFSLGDVAAKKDAAQSFVPGTTNRLNKLQVYLKKTGSPGDITARILINNGTQPGKTVLASTVIPASQITGTYGWIEAAFNNPATLSAGTTYWITLSAASVSTGNYYFWGGDSNNGYGNGVGKYSSNWNAANPIWNNAGGDFDYQIFMGGVATYFDGNLNVGGDLRATEIRSCGAVVGTAYYNTVFTGCPATASTGGNPAPGPASMPISQAQIDEWKSVAAGGGELPGPFLVSGQMTLGPKKINGDLIFETNATLLVTGPIWVKGNITTNNNTALRIDPSLENYGSVILADNPDNPAGSGLVSIYNNTIIEGNGSAGSYLMILSASSNLTTAMLVSNNSNAAIYYASNGVIRVSQNAGAKQITGYKVHLDENATIIYDSGLQSAAFSNGPGGSWVFVPGSFVIDP